MPYNFYFASTADASIKWEALHSEQIVASQGYCSLCTLSVLQGQAYVGLYHIVLYACAYCQAHKFGLRCEYYTLCVWLFSIPGYCGIHMKL